MKRQNLLAVFILAVAVGGCAMLVEYGDAEAEALAYQPFADLDGSDAP
jgi:hypothetical protein